MSKQELFLISEYFYRMYVQLESELNQALYNLDIKHGFDTLDCLELIEIKAKQAEFLRIRDELYILLDIRGQAKNLLTNVKI